MTCQILQVKENMAKLLTCLVCLALSLSYSSPLKILPEEAEKFRDNLRQINELANGDSFDKMGKLLESEDFDKLLKGMISCSRGFVIMNFLVMPMIMLRWCQLSLN